METTSKQRAVNGHNGCRSANFLTLLSQTILKCQVRCTGVLPYHTCPHHLRWRWLSSPRSGRASPWSCYRADRSGPASGSGRPGSSCGSRCKTWNQQSSAGTPAQRWESRGNRGGTTRRKRETQMVRDRHGTGVDGNVCCCFYGGRV